NRQVSNNAMDSVQKVDATTCPFTLAASQLFGHSCLFVELKSALRVYSRWKSTGDGGRQGILPGRIRPGKKGRICRCGERRMLLLFSLRIVARVWGHGRRPPGAGLACVTTQEVGVTSPALPFRCSLTTRNAPMLVNSWPCRFASSLRYATIVPHPQ